jgi:hypothetical protein
MKLRTMLALSVVAFATLFAVFLSFSSRHRGEEFRAFLSAPLWHTAEGRRGEELHRLPRG